MVAAKKKMNTCTEALWTFNKPADTMTSDNKPAVTMTSDEAMQHLGLLFADGMYKFKIMEAWEAKTKFFRGLPASDLKGRMLELYNQKNEARDLLLKSAMIISEGWKQCYLRDPTPTEEDPSYHMKRAHGMLPKPPQPQINIVTGLPKVPIVEQPKPTVVQVSIVDGKPKQPTAERPKPTIAKKPKRPHRASGENPAARAIKKEIWDFIQKQTTEVSLETSMPKVLFSHEFKAAFEKYRKKDLDPHEVPLFKRHWLDLLEMKYNSIFQGTFSTHVAGVSINPQA